MAIEITTKFVIKITNKTILIGEAKYETYQLMVHINFYSLGPLDSFGIVCYLFLINVIFETVYE